MNKVLLLFLLIVSAEGFGGMPRTALGPKVGGSGQVVRKMGGKVVFRNLIRPTLYSTMQVRVLERKECVRIIVFDVLRAIAVTYSLHSH